MDFDVDVVVIGAGVVGLAVARRLAVAGHDVLVLEKNAHTGEETSARNSEVIHAGIYYPQNSLKARFCVTGRQQLYDWCDDHKVAYQRCGKWVVGIDNDEEQALHALFEKGQANGVGSLQMADQAALLDLQQHIPVQAAFLSPETGIIDSHGLMLSLEGELEDHGGMIALNAACTRIDKIPNGFALSVSGADGMMTVTCGRLVNAAGLWAPEIAGNMTFLQDKDRVRPRYCKGQYFTYSGAVPFDRLIYPMPNTAGLGVHLTLDLAGQARFGPDTVWLDGVDYAVDATRKQAFADAIWRYWPGMDIDRLQPGYSGIRPKITDAGDPAADFRIDGPERHKIDGLVNLFGIESPGLTSCLAIGDYVAGLLD